MSHGYPADQGYPGAVVTQQPMGNVPWKHTLCGSCAGAGAGFCLATTFFTPCALCWLSSHTGEHCCVPICLSGAVTLEVARSKLRTLHGLEGNLCNDCLPLTFCTFCFMCQTKAEWDMYRDGRIA